MTVIAPARATAPAPPAFAATRWEGAVAAALTHAPYLGRLLSRRPEFGEGVTEDWPEQLLREAIAEALAIAGAPPVIEDGMRRLRRAKDAVHLAVAIADLAVAWPLARVTGALSDFADASLRAALSLGVCQIAGRGEFVARDFADPDGPAPGFALIAMGKMGAGELNYSSDIDFSVFFDAEALAAAGAREPRVTAVRLVAPMVRALEAVTADGYVFRTDLRLRPDPGSTQVAVSIASAEHYYQTLGQNWERAAFIKARAAAGDRACGQAFLASLEPFIWRKHLDFAAVEDVHSIKRQILSAFGSVELGDPAFDVKLGRGGIRDIELFAQTQQLILGGRNRKLRKSGTIATLAALAEAGAISPSARAALQQAYEFFRGVEHRVQMLEDAHTHRVPADPEVRARVAALAGFETLAAFDAALLEQRRIVAEIDHQLFGREESLADPMGSLSFTGVEDNPETLATIARLGFARPEAVSQTIRGWHHGRIRAMRSERAREVLTRLTPKLLRAFAASGEADHAFVRFAAFFSELSAGVQVLALMEAKPALLDLLARLLSVAPALSERLARWPALLDTLIEPRFAAPLAQDAAGGRGRELGELLAGASEAEARMNVVRRFRREEAFRIAAQVLEGVASAADVGAAYSDLAEVCLAAMADVALAEMQRLQGPQPGRFAVLALGKFGGRELAEGSDLDLMVVYDAPDSGGGDYYARLTQRLISALSAPTAEGALYEIDTKLRPSGSKGPMAVRLTSFERYYDEEAWVWELLALTRLRAVAGDAELGARAASIARAALLRPRARAATLEQVAQMRALMQRERPARDFWDLKLAPGGFVDVEFIAQGLQLVCGDAAALGANTGQTLAALCAIGALAPADADKLGAAWRLWRDLHQLSRLSLANGRLADAPAPLMARLGALSGVADWAGLEALVRRRRDEAREIFVRLIGAGAQAGP